MGMVFMPKKNLNGWKGDVFSNSSGTTLHNLTRGCQVLLVEETVENHRPVASH
jgi:hypothetical protein